MRVFYNLHVSQATILVSNKLHEIFTKLSIVSDMKYNMHLFIDIFSSQMHARTLLLHMKNAQLVTNLQQTCSKSAATNVLTGCASHWLSEACWHKLLQACSRLATSLMNSTPCLQVCSNNLSSGCKSTTCQQVVNHKLGTTWQNNSTATSLLQACCEHNLLTSCAFLRVYVAEHRMIVQIYHLVHKPWTCEIPSQRLRSPWCPTQVSSFP